MLGDKAHSQDQSLRNSYVHIFVSLALFLNLPPSHFVPDAAFQGASQIAALTKDSHDDTRVLATRLAAIGRFAETKRKQEGIPGVALVIVKDDKAIFLNGFGLRDLEHNLPVTVDTLFEIGSTTKPFTGMVAMIGVDEGKLSLDDPPRKYLPYFRLRDSEADSKVTIRDLLSHRTGLVEDDGVWINNNELCREEVIKAIMLNKPTATFREEFQYWKAKGRTKWSG